MKILLASKSPRRRQLIGSLGYEVKTVDVNADEHLDGNIAACDAAAMIAKAKADKASDLLAPDETLLTADTIVVHDDEIMGKPASSQEAVAMLQRLSDDWHTVYTGVCLMTLDRQGQVRQRLFSEATRVHFRRLTPEEIERYVASGSPMDKAGAYGIQDEFGIVAIDRIEGDYYNVVGLPVARIHKELEILIHS